MKIEPIVSVPARGTTLPIQRTLQSTPQAEARTTPQQGDHFHFSLQGKTQGQPAHQIRFSAEAVPSATHSFGNQVVVDSPSDPRPKVFGMLSLTPSQEHQLKAAESRAFDRFRHAANNPEQGSLQAKLSQAAMQHAQPGVLEQMGHVPMTESESKEVMRALTRYGEEVASISIMGRDRKGLQKYVEDRFFVTLFDRDKEAFEDYFKGGVKNFFGDNFGENNLATQAPQPRVSQSEGASSAEADAYRVRYLRPRLGVSISGLDFEELKLRPKVDLVRVQGPAETEIRVEADLPYKIKGEFKPEAHFSARRILNHKPGEYGGLRDNISIEGRTSYAFDEQRVRATVGVNKQISADASVGVYALYSQAFEGLKSEDAAIGINYQQRWD